MNSERRCFPVSSFRFRAGALALLAGVLAVPSSADEPVSAIWRGGSTQSLANPNNWHGKIVPGRVLDESVSPAVTNGTWGSTMVFDGTSTWPDEIKNGGDGKPYQLLSTGRMIFRGENLLANYMSGYHRCTIESGGGIFIEETAGNVFYFKATAYLDFVKAPATDDTVTLRNDATQAPLILGTVNNNFTDTGFDWAVGPIVRIEGRGDVRFDGPVYNPGDKIVTLVVAQEGAGKTIFKSKGTLCFHGLKVPASDTERVVEFLEGTHAHFRIFGADSRPLVVEADTAFTGAGKLDFSKDFNQPANVMIAPGKTLTWGAGLTNEGDPAGDGLTQPLRVYGGGTLCFTAETRNEMTGDVALFDGSTLVTPAVGAAGAASPLGAGDTVTLHDGSSLVYTGDGEAAGDRSVVFSAGGGRLVHLGGGSLAFGTLTVEDGAEIVVTDDATLTVTALTRTVGRVDVTLRPGAVLKIGNLSAGKAPGWLSVNGLPARVDASGSVADIAGPPDVEIDARGGKIADLPDSVVAVAGATGAVDGVTLAASPAAVYVLAQTQSVQPATVTVAPDESLTVGIVSIAEGARPLVVTGGGDFLVDGRLYGGMLERRNPAAGVGMSLTSRTASAGLQLSGNLTEASPLRLTGMDGALAVSGDGSVPASRIVVEGGDLTFADFSAYEPDATARFSESSFNPPLALAVGTNASAATLTFDGGSFTGRLEIGRGTSSAYAKGALYQTGGEIVNVHDNTNDSYGEIYGAHGYAYLGLSGGRFVQTGDWYLGGNGGEAVMDIRGGHLCHTPSSVRESYFRFGGWNTRAVLYVADGGVFDSSKMKGYYALIPSENRQNSNCELTIGENGSVDFGGKEVILAGHAQNNTAYRHYVINLNGGTLRAKRIGCQASQVPPSEEFPEGTGGADRENAYGFVNADGGTLVAVEGSDLFGSRDKATQYPPTRVTAYEKGLTIDTHNVNPRLGVGGAVQAPYGKGVVSIPWDAAADGEGYIGAPVVMIRGDGMGATAFACFDMATRTVTNILVTCRGNGYTWAEADITYRRQVVKTITCGLAENVSGGLTVAGTGMLLMVGTNTYTGATVIKSGAKIRLDADDVISSASTLVLDGGTLYVNGRRQTFAGYEVTANGGAVVGSVAISGLTVDFAKALAGDVVPADFSNVTMPEGAVVKLTGYDPAALAGIHRVKLYGFVPGTAPSAKLALDPSVVLPEGWEFRQNSTGLSIVCPRGMCVICR